MKRIFSVLSVLLLAGCATGGRMIDDAYLDNLAPVRPGYALVYVSRPAHGYASETWPDVYFDETKVVELKNGRFSHVYAAPGRYQVTARKGRWYFGPWGEEITVTLEPDRTYLLSIDVLGRESETGEDRAWTLHQGKDRVAERLRRLRYSEPLAGTVSGAL